jgi:AAA domain
MHIMIRNETHPEGPREVWSGDLDTAVPGDVPWLWHGFLAPGSVTLLTSQWKSGKTTLVSVLLARRTTGGELAGRAVTAGKTAVVSEEGLRQWNLRRRKLGFGNDVALFCRPFHGRPTSDEWLSLLDRLAALRTGHGLDLAVIDTLASFLPGSDENHAGTMLAGLLPLQRLTGLGMSVLLLHHPRKGEPPAGQMARGSGALAGFVDILVEMDRYTLGDDADRRRRLRAYSRFEETPHQLVIELNADGTDYATHGPIAETEFLMGWERLRMVLEDASERLTRRQVRDQWPPDFERPSDMSLWRWLERAVAAGLVCRDGTGRKNAPFRYWLPGREATFLPELPPLPELRPLNEPELLWEAERVLRERRGHREA